MGKPSGIFWLLAVFIIFNQESVTAQSKRSQRSGVQSRSKSTNPKSSTATLSNFECPEEFGYYAHPTDCAQYYVCVFGGALLESCTGGLMYSNELQTCDWPRNVGCEMVDSDEPELPPPPPRASQLAARVRFSSLPSTQRDRDAPVEFKQSSSAPLASPLTQTTQYVKPQQQMRTVTFSPPEPLQYAPNPVVTSRGQPKYVAAEEDIAKLYAESDETLPPIEEEESDRQQRVYRGQPSTIGQVQRDRDGISQQGYNSIPNHGKVGSFSFEAAQPQPFRVESTSQGTNSYIQPQKSNAGSSNNNRNFYNSTNQGYNPQQYDNYYSVYDDDVDLYRDVDYSQQYNTQKPTPPVVKQTTYRPTTTAAIPQTYVQQQKPQQVQYVRQQPTEITYADDYSDDELIAQIQEETPYKTRTQTPLRGDRNELNLISERPALVSSTQRTIISPQHHYSPTSRYVTTQETITHPPPSTTTKTTTTTTTTVAPTHLVTRTNTRTRGGSHKSSQSDLTSSTASVNRGTHPPRARPTLKPSQTITSLSKAQEFVDIYRFPPSRPEPLYPQPTPDKTAAKCRKDVCLLPDCFCGGKDIPGNLTTTQIPQMVLLTFDDAVNDINKDIYKELFEVGRKNPNGCNISATFYVSHEWTDYSQVQDLYADGHEMASHTVSHSFGEQFSQKKWTREISGQREILAAYGGVKLEDVRGMRAPFLSVGGNKMFKMLYDSNFTYDSSMPVYENRPPSWPYTLDYKIFHDCMIPPCPTKSYPGVWEVPMVMWQDLNGGRCSMGDACSNPPESDGVFKMLMKNFDRHYETSRAPFGLYYHAAWFTQTHHKAGFIKFLDHINSMKDVWLVTNWQALQWVRDPTPISRINQFQPFQCNYTDRPKRCNNAKVCNLWHKSGVRYMRSCQPCPEIYPWTGKSGIRSSRVDHEVIEE